MTTTIKERPILFTPAMAAKVYDGSKTQTRRVVKRVPEKFLTGDVAAISNGERWSLSRIAVPGAKAEAWHPDPMPGILCPYGVPGDRLWAKENFRPETDWVEDDGRGLLSTMFDIRYAGDSTGDQHWMDVPESEQRKYTDAYRELIDGQSKRWRPNIHMPRWACRSVLEVLSVRVERVESITEADAIAEGVISRSIRMGDTVIPRPKFGTDPENLWAGSAREAFLHVFYGINKRAPEGSNPWVWVIEFRRIKP